MYLGNLLFFITPCHASRQSNLTFRYIFVVICDPRLINILIRSKTCRKKWLEISLDLLNCKIIIAHLELDDTFQRWYNVFIIESYYTWVWYNNLHMFWWSWTRAAFQAIIALKFCPPERIDFLNMHHIKMFWSGDYFGDINTFLPPALKFWWLHILLLQKFPLIQLITAAGQLLWTFLPRRQPG